MSLRDRLCQDAFLRRCERIQVGSIRLTTPDGRVHAFDGTRAPEIRADLEVADPSLFWDMLTQGDWGLGWGFVHRKWHAKQPGQFCRLLMLNEEVFRPPVLVGQVLSPAMHRIRRRIEANQSPDEAIRRRTISECYDVGNDFYGWVLGPSMVYTCAIWPRPDATLEEAQENKLRLITEKARIEPHHRVIDLGCGFGTLAGYIQRRTGARVKGIALAQSQIDWAREHHPECEFEYLNYAHLTGLYDRIVSVGMAEHVGRKNLRAFLALVADHLEPGGRFVMHTMQSHDGVLMQSHRKRWTSFASVAMPNGDVPSMADIVRASMATGDLRIIHTEGFGIHYARTGQAWLANTRRHRAEIVDAYSEELYRTYEYSWEMGSAAFESGITLAHVVFEKKPFGAPYTNSIL